MLPPQAVLQGPGPGLQLQLPGGAEPWALRDRGGLRGPIALLRCPPHTSQGSSETVAEEDMVLFCDMRTVSKITAGTEVMGFAVFGRQFVRKELR